MTTLVPIAYSLVSREATKNDIVLLHSNAKQISNTAKCGWIENMDHLENTTTRIVRVNTNDRGICIATIIDWKHDTTWTTSINSIRAIMSASYEVGEHAVCEEACVPPSRDMCKNCPHGSRKWAGIPFIEQ